MLPLSDKERRMGTVMSATQARVHFGEVLRRVRGNEVITVEHAGKPEAVIMSVQEYERLRANTPTKADWWERARLNRERIDRELGDREFPDVVDILHELREERDAQILDSMR
jgi:prevent-host-death family protein